MSRTYVKGRISKDKRRGFRRITCYHKCQCFCCGYNGRRKGWKKTIERNTIKSILNEYYFIKNKCNY